MSLCKLCGDKFMSQEDLDTHYVSDMCPGTMQEDQRFVCIICEKRFMSKYKCRDHQEKCMKKKKTRYLEDKNLKLRTENKMLRDSNADLKQQIT